MNHLKNKGISAVKRYYSFGDYLKERFGCRIQKITIDASFTCPNRDGTVGWGGCTYCRNQAFSLNSNGKTIPIKQQIQEGMDYLKNRFRASRFIAYFQAYSNTYARIGKLKKYYEQALSFKDVVGLSVGTRPDLVPAEVLELLAGYAKKYEVWIEYGIQSICDDTLKRINRGHDVETFLDAVKRTKEFPELNVCAHVILGFPWETREEMLRSAAVLSDAGIHGIKLHLLHVVRGTPMEIEYLKGNIRLLEEDEYISLVCDYLERLDPEIVIQRLTGEAPRELLVAPQWCLNKKRVINRIDEELLRRDSRQGCKREI